MRRSRTLSVLALVIALSLSASTARADFLTTVTVDVTPEAGGLSLYTYTVTDLPTSTSNVSEFDLSLTTIPSVGITTPVGASLSSITMPNGFIALYTTGDPTISFTSTDPSTDLAAGSVGIFSFLSATSPLTVPFLLTDLNSGNTVPGSILAPATVPEPSSLVLSSLGVIGGMGWLARGRRRASTV